VSGVRRHLQNSRPPGDHTYGDGDAGSKIADCLARWELTVEKRLTY
jgi:hypothetical protein